MGTDGVDGKDALEDEVVARLMADAPDVAEAWLLYVDVLVMECLS